MQDTYLTIEAAGEGIYREKMSRFLSFAVPVSSVGEAREYIELYKKEYYDARHVCWAYMIGADRTCFRSNDNGEPSGTAGKPILGQINSNNLTDILIVVVRYFGGIKLGTSGLIIAYRSAAAEAIAACNVVERLVEDIVNIQFEYPLMNEVMHIVKEEQTVVLSQSFEMDCKMSLKLRRSAMPRLCSRLDKIRGLTILPDDTKNSDDDTFSDKSDETEPDL